jgi:hypothetical protein
MTNSFYNKNYCFPSGIPSARAESEGSNYQSDVKINFFRQPVYLVLRQLLVFVTVYGEMKRRRTEVYVVIKH